MALPDQLVNKIPPGKLPGDLVNGLLLIRQPQTGQVAPEAALHQLLGLAQGISVAAG